MKVIGLTGGTGSGKSVVSRFLKENMEQAVALAVPLDVDVHEGQNWLDAK